MNLIEFPLPFPIGAARGHLYGHREKTHFQGLNEDMLFEGEAWPVPKEFLHSSWL
jgi:hypothetical protein